MKKIISLMFSFSICILIMANVSKKAITNIDFFWNIVAHCWFFPIYFLENIFPNFNNLALVGGIIFTIIFWGWVVYLIIKIPITKEKND